MPKPKTHRCACDDQDYDDGDCSPGLHAPIGNIRQSFDYYAKKMQELSSVARRSSIRTGTVKRLRAGVKNG